MNTYTFKHKNYDATITVEAPNTKEAYFILGTITLNPNKWDLVE